MTRRRGSRRHGGRRIRRSRRGVSGSFGRAKGFLGNLLRRPVSGVLAPGLGFAAIAVPFLEPASNPMLPEAPDVFSAVQFCLSSGPGGGAVMNTDGTVNWGLSGANAARIGTSTFISSLVSNWPTMVGLGVGAAVARWGGRKLRI